MFGGGSPGAVCGHGPGKAGAGASLEAALSESQGTGNGAAVGQEKGERLSKGGRASGEQS